jgi:hypothetical protein
MLIALYLSLTVASSMQAAAQAINTPLGELRLGMSKDEVKKVLGESVRELNVWPSPIYLQSLGDRRSVQIQFTSRGFAYGIYLSESLQPGDSSLAETKFFDALRTYNAPPDTPLDQRFDDLSETWQTSEGNTMTARLECVKTQLSVSLTDNRKHQADDASKVETGVQVFDSHGEWGHCTF